MKKIVLTLVLLCLLSCSEESTTFNEENNNAKISFSTSKNEGWNRVTRSTDLISNIFYDAGIVKVHVEEESNRFIYRFETSRPVMIDGKEVDFATKEFIVEDNSLIYERSSSGYILKYDNGIITLRSPESENFKEIAYFDNKVEISLLLQFCNELTLLPGDKLTVILHDQNAARGGACDPSKIRTMTSSSSTRAGALAGLAYYEQHGYSYFGGGVNGFNCRKLSDKPEVRDLLGVQYFATSTWCCGNSGAGGSW